MEKFGIDVQKNIINQNTVGAYSASKASSDYCIGIDGKFKKFDLILDLFCAEKVTHKCKNKLECTSSSKLTQADHCIKSYCVDINS